MVKLTSVEPIVYVERQRKRQPNKTVERFLISILKECPELTEVILSTLLDKEGITYECLTIDQFLSKKDLREKALKKWSTVFISTTFLRDLSEMIPIVNLIKTFSNKIVVGGPSKQLFKEHLTYLKDVDVVCLDYGELFIPSIADWIKSDHQTLDSPERGKIEDKHGLKIMYSGHPEGT